MHGNRIHKLDAPVGNLTVDYAATIVGQTDPAPVTEYDLSMYLRPSRYAEADKFLRVRRNGIRQLHRFDDSVGGGVLVGGPPG